MGSNYANFDTMLSDMIACFEAFEIRQVGTLQGAIVVEYKANAGDPEAPGGTVRIWRRDLWTIYDNGGEFNVQRVNDDESHRSIPYTWFGLTLDGATMAWRIRKVLDVEEIDYDFRMDDMLEDLKAYKPAA